jgi:hypothetical protein
MRKAGDFLTKKHKLILRDGKGRIAEILAELSRRGENIPAWMPKLSGGWATHGEVLAKRFKG